MIVDVSAWDRAKSTLFVGRKLSVTVKSHAPFGVFVTIPGLPFEGLVKIHDFKDEGEGRMTPAEYPPVGAKVDGVVLGFNEMDHELWFSMKPSLLRE